MSFPHQNNELHSRIYMSSNTYNSRYSHQVRPTSFLCILIFVAHFCFVHLQLKMKRHLTNAILTPFRPFATASGLLDGCSVPW